jgi:hypothetical protein
LLSRDLYPCRCAPWVSRNQNVTEHCEESRPPAHFVFKFDVKPAKHTPTQHTSSQKHTTPRSDAVPHSCTSCHINHPLNLTAAWLLFARFVVLRGDDEGFAGMNRGRRGLRGGPHALPAEQLVNFCTQQVTHGAHNAPRCPDNDTANLSESCGTRSQRQWNPTQTFR